jgi:ABC-2 type transport system ATP-binding protein
VSAAIQTRLLRKVYRLPGGRRGLIRSLAAGNAGRGPAVPGGRTAAQGDRREIVALEGLDLEVEAGEFFGLLGPNGAGKTTTIGVLTTRVRPTSGQARVAGADVASQAVEVRRRIGVVPQRPNPDRGLRVAENLIFHAAYFGIPFEAASTRARELLDSLELGERGESKVDELSGGQQQRLMIARALIHDPEILFLDEPTVGLDPQARHALWEILRRLNAEGRTIVMTTHYMEEADQLCRRVAIIDHGRLLALDTPVALKARAPGGTLIELTVEGEAAPLVAGARELAGVTRAEAEGQTLRTHAERAGDVIPKLIKLAEASGCPVRDIHLSPPSLETLFVSLTGRKLD